MPEPEQDEFWRLEAERRRLERKIRQDCLKSIEGKFQEIAAEISEMLRKHRESYEVPSQDLRSCDPPKE